MLRIGLTGGIGSGKTIVARIFEVLGIPVYYADDAAKLLMSSDNELKASLIQHFGKETFRDGQLNRSYLAGIVFDNPQKLEMLNALTHPAVIRDANRWMLQQSAPYTIKEAALLFESGSDAYLDHVIGVYAPADLRIQRAMTRDNITREDLLKRMNRQMDEETKLKRCDSIIVNDENQLVIPQVLALHTKFLEMKNV